MELCNSQMPGVQELYSVGFYPTEASYNSAITSIYSGITQESAFLIASVTTKQKEGIRLLLSKGFTQMGRAKKNPNSGNKILLFIKALNKGARNAANL